jgi:phthiocerol/phenolphthiocerol synthesis type-I polyketide synthase E
VTIEQPHGHGYLHREGEILSPTATAGPSTPRRGGPSSGAGWGWWCSAAWRTRWGRDTVHAVILGSAVNNDGSSEGRIPGPSVDGQARAIAEALGVADVDPATIGFVAAHGTGTPWGIPSRWRRSPGPSGPGPTGRGYCALGR